MTSYRHPLYAKAESKVEKDLGLPSGFLADIRTKGEKSNSDEVSEAGARTVYQIIPSTRNAIKSRYGVDAYAGPEQAARAAGLILKENLDRNGGNKAAAAAEYHGGTDRGNWGKRTKAYVNRVTGGGDPASADDGSTYDRVTARQRANQGPDLTAIYQAYKNTGKPGGMTQQQAAQYERDVMDGHIMVPRGGSIRVKPSAPILPAGVIKAINSGEMDDKPEMLAQVFKDVEDGIYSLPKGAKLAPPKQRTFMDNINLGLSAVRKGLAAPADMVVAPVNTIVNAVTGANLSPTPFRDQVEADTRLLGGPEPRNDTERRNAAIVEGGSSVLPLLPAIAASPLAAVTEVASGGASGYSSETARQAGAGPVGQFVAGLAGGVTPAGLVIAGEKTATRIRAPKTLPDVVAEVPRSAVIDEAGNLTPDGQEIAARHGVTQEDVVKAYERTPEEAGWAANDEQTPSVAREATNDAPVAPEQPERTASQPVAEQPQPVRAAPEAESVTPPPSAAPATALDRVQAGQEFGIDYSRGEATKNFDIQDAEQRLSKSNGPEAEQMRQFKAKQQEQVKAASEQFRSAFGDTAATAEERGESVQEAVRELRDLGQQGVNELYKQARELGAPVELDTAKIRNSIEGLMAEADIPEQVKKVIEQEAARYGLIGKPVVVDKATGAVTNEAGVTTVKLDDGQTIKFRGEPETLRLDNADKFRTVISKQYLADGPMKLTQELKRVIDDVVEETATKLAQGGKGKISEALGTARKAVAEQKQTFANKDIIQDIVDWKKGSSTGKLAPEAVMRRALASTSDLKKVKAVLLSKGTVKSKAAWRGIQAHGLAQIFKEAISGAKLRSAIDHFGLDKLKVLLDPEDFGKLMKLRRVIEDVTIPITGTTNPSGSGNLLMRLMADVDNKVTGAFASAGFAIGGPAGGAIGGFAGRTIGPVVKQMKEAKAAAETLKGATEYTAETAAKETATEGAAAPRPSVASKVKSGAAKSVKAFIDVYSDPRIIAPVVASAGGVDE